MSHKLRLHVSMALCLGLALGVMACDDGATEVTDGMGGSGGSGGAGAAGGSGGIGGTGGTAGMGGMGGSAGMGGTGGMDCECPRELDCLSGECVEHLPCERDTHCAEGNICVDGACVAGCGSDAQCAEADAGAPWCVEGRCVQCSDDEQCFGMGTCVDAQCQEPEACTDSRECLGDRICSSGVCEDAFDCNAEGNRCPDGQVCTEMGACVIDPDAPCESDDDCSVIGHVCRVDQRPARCAPCQEDAHCPDAQRCVIAAGGNRCAEPAVCRTSADCLGSRICDGGACVPPACMDDMLEENDTVEEASEIIAGVIRDLVSCGDDADWYAVVLPADHAATISVRQADSDVDLSLAVRNVDGAVLADSATEQPVEAVVVGPYPSEQTVYAVVDQRGPLSAGAYVLEVELVDDGVGCIDDAFESGVGDDTQETGRRVRAPGEIGFGDDLGGRLCPGDSDFICFHAENREQVTINIEVTSGDLEVAGTVYRGNGDAFADSVWNRRGGEEIGFRAGRGEFCLGLTANSGTGSYAVDISAIPTQLIRLCEEAEPLVLVNGRTTVQAQLGLDSVFSPLCAGGAADGGEKIYSVTFGPDDQLPLLLTAQVEGIAGGTLGDPVVSVRGVCGDGSTEIGCSTGSRDPDEPQFSRTSPAVVRVPVTEPGTYFIAVDGTRIGARPNFRLEVETNSLSGPPVNDTCDTAEELAFNPAGVTVVGVNLDQATDQIATCSGEGGPDAVYRLNFLERAYVRLQATAADNAFAVGASLSSECRGGDALQCGFGFEGIVEPGVYYLTVDGSDPNSRGRVTVQMVVDSIGDAPANETCDQAEALEGSQGGLSASTVSAADDYVLVDANLCTGHNSVGGDVVYSFVAAEDGRMFVQATPEGGWDLSLYVVSACNNPARNRIACSDGGLTEAAVFDLLAGESVFVVVDGSNGEAGPFQLRWGTAECRIDVDCPAGRCQDFRCVE